MGHPHEIAIDLGREIDLAGFVYVPRQDMKNGRVDRYEFYASSNDGDWGDAIHKGRFPDAKTRQVVRFEQPVMARFIRLVALSEVAGGPWTSIAELDIIQVDR